MGGDIGLFLGASAISLLQYAAILCALSKRRFRRVGPATSLPVVTDLFLRYARN